MVSSCFLFSCAFSFTACSSSLTLRAISSGSGTPNEVSTVSITEDRPDVTEAVAWDSTEAHPPHPQPPLEEEVSLAGFCVELYNKNIFKKLRHSNGTDFKLLVMYAVTFHQKDA